MEEIARYIREYHPSLLIDINQMPTDQIAYLDTIAQALKQDVQMREHAIVIEALITNIDKIDLSCRGDMIVMLLYPFIKPIENNSGTVINLIPELPLSDEDTE